MKIFANIPGAYKLIHCLKYLRPYKSAIENARAQGDTELERKYILEATSKWGGIVMDMFGSSVNIHGAENLPEKESALMQTMLLGEKGELDSELKALYQRNGIAHILAISGVLNSILGHI